MASLRKPLKENISFLKEKIFPLRIKIKILKGKYHISSIPIFRAFEKIEMNVEQYLHGCSYASSSVSSSFNDSRISTKGLWKVLKRWSISLRCSSSSSQRLISPFW